MLPFHSRGIVQAHNNNPNAPSLCKKSCSLLSRACLYNRIIKSKHCTRHSFLKMPFTHSTNVLFTSLLSVVLRDLIALNAESTTLLKVLFVAALTADMPATMDSGSMPDACDIEFETCWLEYFGSNQFVLKSKSETTRMPRRREQ
jgi:hypothetical protein